MIESVGGPEAALTLFPLLWPDLGRVLTRLDPLSLRPSGPRVTLPEYHDAWSFSPDRSQLALGIILLRIGSDEETRRALESAVTGLRAAGPALRAGRRRAVRPAGSRPMETFVPFPPWPVPLG